MTRCKGCGKEFRKGTLAFLLTAEGLKGARVCQACAGAGMLIVAPKLAPVAKKVVDRKDDVHRVLRGLRSYVGAARISCNNAGNDEQLRFEAQGRVVAHGDGGRVPPAAADAAPARRGVTGDGRGDGRCAWCGASLGRRRADAVYCSLRHRVAACRARRASRGPS